MSRPQRRVLSLVLSLAVNIANRRLALVER